MYTLNRAPFEPSSPFTHSLIGGDALRCLRIIDCGCFKATRSLTHFPPFAVFVPRSPSRVPHHKTHAHSHTRRPQNSLYIYLSKHKYIYVFQKQPSLSMRRASLKRRPSSTPANAGLPAQKEIPWDLFDRLLLPLLGCHGAAILISGLLHLLRISQVSTVALFVWFAASTVGAILFYHYLKVCLILPKYSSFY